ncbi:MAG TPA: prephenate dehydrogenase/arogenate dehydrogenase family protein [Polyangiaceae bacterium]
MKQIAIFGFGLVGGSIAAAVREAAPEIELVAVDLTDIVASSPVRALAHRCVDSTDREAVRAVTVTADVCVLAAPVGVITAELPGLLELAQVVTDCGSTKRSICAAVSGAARIGRFVPGHPMAGGPEGGAALARADLFRGQTWLLCPENSDADAVIRVESLVQMLGAKVVHMSLAAHDRAVAYTSHAPQLFASALAVLAEEAGAVCAAGPAYRATTRSAGGAERMWRDIFAANADEISSVLRQLSAELQTVAAGLEAKPTDPSAALALLARARATRK